jgi:hypothetical protein
VSLPTALEVHDDVVPNPSAVIDFIAEHPQWQISPVGKSPTTSDIRTSSSLFLPFLSFANPPVIHELARSVWSVMTDYARRFSVRITSFEPISFNRYEPGQEFHVHSDYFEGSNRVISAVAYLNTVEEGGMTNFIHYGVEVEAVAARVAVFPSNFVFAHAALPPLSGIKYSAALWARG